MHGGEHLEDFVWYIRQEIAPTKCPQTSQGEENTCEERRQRNGHTPVSIISGVVLLYFRQPWMEAKKKFCHWIMSIFFFSWHKNVKCKNLLFKTEYKDQTVDFKWLLKNELILNLLSRKK